MPLPKPGWGGGVGAGAGAGYGGAGGGPPPIDGFAHLAPSRWKDSVVTEEQVDKMADRRVPSIHGSRFTHAFSLNLRVV